MTFRCYVPKTFREKDLVLIGLVNEVVERYEKEMGLSLMVRKIHYQLVTMPDADYANTSSNYQRLVRLLNDARMAGLVSWTAVEDPGRVIYDQGYDEHPHDVFKNLEETYRKDKWCDQEWFPIVGIEKLSLQGTISGICRNLEVPFIAMKGYGSASTLWRLGNKMIKAIRRGQRPIFFYAGDHDPSGLDIDRDIAEKLALFCGTPVMVQRLALTRPQIEEHGIYENPLKLRADGELSDSRGKAYMEQHGEKSWELDGMNPRAIQDLVSGAVKMIRDQNLWDRALAQEAEDKIYIQDLLTQLGIGANEDNEDED